MKTDASSVERPSGPPRRGGRRNLSANRSADGTSAESQPGDIGGTATSDGTVGPEPDAPRFSIVRITPEMARALLGLRRPGANRNQAAVSSYAQAMRAGEWILNGMPLILSRKGLLLDGVQRLYACVEANIAFDTVFAKNIADDTVHTLDQQRRRSFTGVLETRGVPRAAAVANLLAKLIRYEDGTLTRGTSTPPWSRMERSLEANREAIDTAVKFSFDHPARVLSESIRTPLSFMGLQADRAAIRRFLDAIAHPERFSADEPGVMIRRRLLEGRVDAARRIPVITLFALCVKALNDTILNTRNDTYAWAASAQSGRGPEPFPTLHGYTGLHALPESNPPEFSDTASLEPRRSDHGSHDHLIMTVETIGPERAEQYLAANRGNRNIVQAHVSALARDIRNGQWMFNAQPICFSASGRLLNGQHRLSAVLEAGQPIEVLLMRGLAEEAFRTYDKQAKKAPALDEMFDDFGDKALISATAVLLWRRELRPEDEPAARPTASEIRDVIRSHPELMKFRGFARKLMRYGRASALVYAGYRIMRDDAALGRLFLDRMETAANLPAGHIILRLRDRMIDLRKADQNTQIDEILAAWDRFRKRPGIPV
jgi:hypothetical protein